jgi:hypothetical protein
VADVRVPRNRCIGLRNRVPWAPFVVAPGIDWTLAGSPGLRSPRGQSQPATAPTLDKKTAATTRLNVWVVLVFSPIACPRLPWR